MIYLYAITEKIDERLDALQGVDSAPLAYVHLDRLTAVVSTGVKSALAPSPRRLWQHEQVVEGVMQGRSVYPARFSTLFPDRAAVKRYMAANRETLLGSLERVHGCVELSLRVIRLWASHVGGDGAVGYACPEPEAGGGEEAFYVARRAVALQRALHHRQEECLGEQIHRALASTSIEARLHEEDRPGVLLKSAYLVEVGRLGVMQRAVRRMMNDHPNMHFFCTGPWPPYHFVPAVAP